MPACEGLHDPSILPSALPFAACPPVVPLADHRPMPAVAFRLLAAEWRAALLSQMAVSPVHFSLRIGGAGSGGCCAAEQR